MSSMVLDGASPRSRSTDPITSVDAGRVANLPASQFAVLQQLERLSDATQYELELLLGDRWSPSRVRSAVSELEQAGLVVAAGWTRPTRYGRQARVYRVAS